MSKKASGELITEAGYYCDCKDPSLPKSARHYMKIRKVVVDEEGICKDCEHYATYKKVGDYGREAPSYTGIKGASDEFTFIF